MTAVASVSPIVTQFRDGRIELLHRSGDIVPREILEMSDSEQFSVTRRCIVIGVIEPLSVVGAPDDYYLEKPHPGPGPSYDGPLVAASRYTGSRCPHQTPHDQLQGIKTPNGALTAIAAIASAVRDEAVALWEAGESVA
jgi:hypothetical protein